MIKIAVAADLGRSSLIGRGAQSEVLFHVRPSLQPVRENFYGR